MKTYHVISLNGNHEYNIQVEEVDYATKYRLFRSKNNEWSNPGEKIMSITERPDLTIKLPKMERIVEYDYAFALGILLRFIANYNQEEHVLDQNFNVIDSSNSIKV